jgi:uncharacterized membrane protein (DUF2068 family)
MNGVEQQYLDVPNTRVARFARGARSCHFRSIERVDCSRCMFWASPLIHRDLQAVAENIVRHLHLNPARYYPRIFIEELTAVSDARLVSLAALAFLYGAVRLTEAYGLRRMSSWAEWFAIVSGAIYVPMELFELYKRVTWTGGLSSFDIDKEIFSLTRRQKRVYLTEVLCGIIKPTVMTAML